MVTLLDDKYTFLIISRSVLLRMRNVPDIFFKNLHRKFNIQDKWLLYLTTNIRF